MLNQELVCENYTESEKGRFSVISGNKRIFTEKIKFELNIENQTSEERRRSFK